jgi:hypothetical protein
MDIRKNRLYMASGVEDLRDVALYDLLQGLCPRQILPEMIGPHRHRRFLLCPAPGGLWIYNDVFVLTIHNEYQTNASFVCCDPPSSSFYPF